MTQPEKTLETRSLCKTFPGVCALDNVDFSARAGEVHAVVGANGAGKSTLAKILSGAYHPDSGEISLFGEIISINSPLDAKRKGIICTYQEVDTALVRYLSVAENVMINQLVTSPGVVVNWGEINQKAKEYLHQVDLDVDVKKQLLELTLSQKQKVVIAQALEQKAKFLILDEPTAPLSLREVEQLFKLIRALTKKGIGIIYISHRMTEVFEIADRISVMRDGRLVTTLQAKETNPEEIIFHMLEKTFDQAEQHSIRDDLAEKPIVFEVKNLKREPLVNDVSFFVREGEVLGITGLVGAGKTELARVLFGADKLRMGEINLSGKPIRVSSPAEAVEQGLMLVPEERRRQGVLVDFNITQNLTIPSLKRFSRGGILNQKMEKKASQKIVEDLKVICRGVEQEVKYLSGGNQQKIAVGKWLVTPGQVFLFDEPTKGVDIGAKEEIFRLVSSLAKAGAAVVYFSSEIPEILRMSDRILVLYDGKVAKELDRKTATDDLILKYATGGGDHNDK